MLVQHLVSLLCVAHSLLHWQGRPPLVIVDKQTRKPLAAVSVRVDAATLTTDAAGKVTLPAAYISATATHVGYSSVSWLAAQAPFLDTLALQPQEIALPNVQIRAVQTVDLTSINRKTTAANPFYPGTEVAIRFTLPDSIKTYRLRAVTLPVKESFKEGRIRLNICMPGNSTTLLGTRLLPDTVFSAALAPAVGRQPVVRFDVSSFALVLPKSGFFLLLDCLPGDVASRVIRQRLESKKGPNKKGVSKGVMYLEVEDKEQNSSRAISVYDYPQLLTTPTEGVSATWRRFSPTLPFQQLSPSVSRGNKIRAYNIAAALEVEVW